MATRMATLLYGDKPGCDVEAGNRADAADLALPAPAPPFPLSPSFLPPTPPRVRTQPLAAAATPMRPPYPTPNPEPWLGHRVASLLPAVMLGVVAAAAVFAGLAVFGVALAWSSAMTLLAQVVLMVIGGYLISVGVAYVVSARAQTA